ncbi:hypothetical protein Moror_997 [Moniliophthora roreri MCA 2997]|uniref:Protein kinase domain-containing protein n=2 Tax=Moniliophthora roreri TaxID=221103 RepID=V2X8C9_MONRO|nr:hypothetical protein Moror_997 [Moniliophthora roreri MCA 2997]KAI3611436.1 hypothetical protein WG66_002128 [Moniliophthora roreri]
MQFDVPHYIPPFIWKFWLSNNTPTSRLHVYDVHSTDLFEASQDDLENVVPRPVFQDLNVPSRIYPAVQIALREAEEAFLLLQKQAGLALENAVTLIKRSSLSTSPGKRTTITISRRNLSVIVKFLTFLRFRNSRKYSEIVDSLLNNHEPYPATPPPEGRTLRGNEILSIYNDFIQQIRYKKLLRSFLKFFQTDIQEMRPISSSYEIPASAFYEELHIRLEPAEIRRDPWLEAFNVQCWNFCREADVFFGSASEEDEQEFILPDTCFGTLDENFGGGLRETDLESMTLDAFFPISPTLALYIIQGGGWQNETSPFVTVEVGEELYTDVHLRNAMILSTVPYDPNLIRQPFITFDESFPPEEPKPCYPSHSYHTSTKAQLRKFSTSGPRIYFRCLSSISRSISSYDLFRVRWMVDTFVDYTRLKQRCRQKYLTLRVTKMLTVKDVKVLDLTDEVEMVGKDPVGFGAFSDVWMGKWYDKVEGRERVVAIKYLRQVMVQNVREKFLKRLHAEVHIWHQLCHRNLASLYGLVKRANSVGMVSPWCDNGTLCHYVKRNPSTNRLKLLLQIASGIAYLHNFVPPVVHGDLKGGNILIDSDGQAVITDFGLSKVMQDLTSSISEPGQMVPTSFFAGSTRWMSPELIQAIVEDDSNVPRVTTFSDVYAFASVCLEVITGQLPYPHRTNDYQVTFDILRGIKPCGAISDISCEQLGIPQPKVSLDGQDVLREFLNKCWDTVPYLRPKMTEAVRFLADLE